MRSALLLSGGIDSAAILFWKRPRLAITVDYGQRPAAGEIAASTALCEAVHVKHDVIRLNCGDLGAGLMSSSNSKSNRKLVQASPEWWPFRNQLLLTVAAARAIQYQIDSLLIGTVKSDSRHHDGTKRFVKLIDALCALQEGNIHVRAPALGMSSTELIRRSKLPRSLLGWTHSCHVGVVACGTCPGCVQHRDTLAALNWR